MKDKRRIEALVGAPEASDYLAIERACRQASFAGIAFLPPPEVGELRGNFRPGLVAFARESAGDFICWDLRFRRPGKKGPPASVVYCDHEVGLAEPIASGIKGALAHVIVREITGQPRDECIATLDRSLEQLASLLDEPGTALLRRLAKEARKKGRGPILPTVRAMEEAVRPLTPKQARGGLCILPPTSIPLLDPEDPSCLDNAVDRYEESIATYRAMIDEEGRDGFRWYLANALRGLAEVLLRRDRLDDAARAATEAIAIYEPLHDAGELRVETHLAFVHRVLAVTLARNKKSLAHALEHAERALALGESSLIAAFAMLTATTSALNAWHIERTGGSREEAELALSNAKKWSAPYLDREPPHPLRDSAEVISKLTTTSIGKAKRRRRS